VSHFFISAAHKSSGKTTLTIGLCATLAKRGFIVQPFKKGLDYIDPLWLTQSAGRPCHNLDFHTMNQQEILKTAAKYTQTADIAVIEGNKGLYDGVDVEGSNSNAALAHLLKSPVILVLNTQGITRGIAPLILGYQNFDQKINIAGVILNQMGGSRHESKLRAVIERYTDMSVLGALQRDDRLKITERYLGLMPSNEDNQAQIKIDNIAQLIEQHVDIKSIINISKQSTPFPAVSINSQSLAKPDLQIGIIRDAAFGFYYPSDLTALEEAGAELIFINALHDTHLPTIDALFIGGGFPEQQMEKLSKNNQLKQAIRYVIENNLPVYAECGGLMYLGRQLTWQGKTCNMVGALPLDTVMDERPQGRGYIRLRETEHSLWAMGEKAEFNAHEFHYSKAVNIAPNLSFAYKVLRGTGLDGQHDGVVYKNTLACYAHLRDVENNHWTQRFVEFIRKYKRK